MTSIKSKLLRGLRWCQEHSLWLWRGLCIVLLGLGWIELRGIHSCVQSCDDSDTVSALSDLQSEIRDLEKQLETANETLSAIHVDSLNPRR